MGGVGIYFNESYILLFCVNIEFQDTFIQLKSLKLIKILLDFLLLQIQSTILRRKDHYYHHYNELMFHQDQKQASFYLCTKVF